MPGQKGLHLPAPQVHPDYKLMTRVPVGLTKDRIRKQRRLDPLMGLRIRHRGTTLEKRSAPVPMRIVRPKNQRTPAPALLLLHGGGYVLGNAASDDRVASRIARELGITVVSVEYRLAPEHPFPAGRDDGYAGLTWLAEQPWVDPKRIAVGGASAGGGLAAAVVQHAHDQGKVDVCFQLLVYPMLDDRSALRDDVQAGDHAVWNKDSNHVGWACYLGHEPGSADIPADAVPSRRVDLSGLPPAWIGVGSADLFHDEDVDYARRLMAAGVACELDVVEGATHGFERFAPRKALSRSFSQAQVDALRRGLGI